MLPNYVACYSSPFQINSLFNVSGDCYNRGERIDTSKFGADPGLAAENISSDVDVSLSKETTSDNQY